MFLLSPTAPLLLVIQQTQPERRRPAIIQTLEHVGEG